MHPHIPDLDHDPTDPQGTVSEPLMGTADRKFGTVTLAPREVPDGRPEPKRCFATS